MKADFKTTTRTFTPDSQAKAPTRRTPARSTPQTIHELYFSDPNKPKGQRFLGAVLFDMPDTDALPAGVLAVACSMQAHRLGINPGGEMRVYARDESEREKLTPFLNRLLTEGEGLELGLFTYKAGGAA